MIEDDIKRWTTLRKAARALEIIQGKTAAAEAGRSFDMSPAEIEAWVEDGKRGMENALRAKALEICEGCERRLNELQTGYGAMLALRAR